MDKTLVHTSDWNKLEYINIHCAQWFQDWRWLQNVNGSIMAGEYWSRWWPTYNIMTGCTIRLDGYLNLIWSRVCSSLNRARRYERTIFFIIRYQMTISCSDTRSMIQTIAPQNDHFIWRTHFARLIEQEIKNYYITAPSSV